MSGMRILIQPTALSRAETLKAALRVLQAEGIAVVASWFFDADVALEVSQQDAAKVAGALEEAGLRAMTRKTQANT
jgi:hypothetical protein